MIQRTRPKIGLREGLPKIHALDCAFNSKFYLLTLISMAMLVVNIKPW